MKKTLTTIFSLAAFALASFASSPWQPAGETIRTKWADEVNPLAPLPEYPRPQMVRNNWLNLNGMWDYAITPADAEGFTPEGKILVPFAVESSLSGVGRQVGKNQALWYERTFDLPKGWKGKDVLLHFGAVDWKASVYVNDVLLAEHTGGYAPFTVNVTSVVKAKGNKVKVRVWDATDDSWQPRGKQVNAPQSIWYTPVTGIWQTVWLESVPNTHIDSYYVVYDSKRGNHTVSIDIENLQQNDVVKFELLEGGIGYSAEKPGSKVVSDVEACGGNGEDFIMNFFTDDVNLWSPDNPYLYGVRISVIRGGKVIDSVDGYTALREISVCKEKGYSKRMALNGKPLFHFGPLDQGWWPDGLYTAPTDEALHYDIAKTKEWGFNMIRKHIKVEPARWYYWADVEGILVWQDMPCIGDYCKGVIDTREPEIAEGQRNKWSRDSFLDGTDCVVPQEWKDNFYKEWSEIIDAVRCFQCIVVWVPFNEAWGQFDTRKVVDFTREKDPTRLINQSSGGNFEFCGDIQDCHHYPQPAMNAVEGKFVNVLGEYGGIGYPVEGHLWKKDKNWGYGDVKHSQKELMDQYEAYAELLKHYIWCGTAAAVYTQTTDVEVEVNGIMTYDRIVKVDEAKFREINQSVINTPAK
ncbi:MAG: glycoside hydrolase family 2 protein [Candidatus Cryptobacteroides sp.]